MSTSPYPPHLWFDAGLKGVHVFMGMPRSSRKYKSTLAVKTILFSIAVVFGLIMSMFLIFARDLDAFVSGLLFFAFSAWGTYYSDKLLDFDVDSGT